VFPDMENPTVRLAIFWEKSGTGVRCLNCFRSCTITPGGEGFCKTRRATQDGSLETLVYGAIASLGVNPIEKKPMNHFWPGSHALTIGTWSCNLKCPWCQNWELSKTVPHPSRMNYVPPEELVGIAVAKHTNGVSFSFNEPTLLAEYALDVFPLAREKGLYCQYVTNGSMSIPVLESLARAGLTGLTVTIKGRRDAAREITGQNTDHTWEFLSHAKNLGLSVEVVLLAVTGFADDERTVHEISSRIVTELSVDTPFHINAYFPAYKYAAPPTSFSALNRAHEITRDEGLRFVYIGNVEDQRQNTNCPDCGTLLIERSILGLSSWKLTTANKCPVCCSLIPIVGKPSLPS